MISIEEVTDAESEQRKPVHASGTQATAAAESSDHTAASAVDAPQTDAHAEGEEQQVAGSSEQDTLVRAALFRLVTSRCAVTQYDLSCKIRLC